MTQFYSNSFDNRFGWACQLIIDSLLLLTFFLAAIPETLLPQPSVTGLQFCMLPYFPALALLVLRWFGSWNSIRLPLLGLLLGGLWMALVGFFSLKDVLSNKSFAGDLIMFSGLICGFIWAEHLDAPSAIRKLRTWALVTLVLAFVTIAALQVGALSSLGGENRLYVYSLYWGSWLLTCLAPVLIATADIDAGQAMRFMSAAFWRAAGYACLACAFLMGFVSATRSVVIGGLASLLLVVFLERKRLNPSVKILIGIFALIGLIYLGANAMSWFSGSELSARFQSKEMGEESRMIELSEMFDTIEEKNNGGGYWYGLGFGSVFFSTGINTPSYVINPHVAVLTLLFKGGIPVFFFCTLVPCAVCFLRLLRRNIDTAQRAACAGALLYFLQASLSGGWDFKNLFLLGACYALCFGKASIRSVPVHEPEPLTVAETA